MSRRSRTKNAHVASPRTRGVAPSGDLGDEERQSALVTAFTEAPQQEDTARLVRGPAVRERRHAAGGIAGGREKVQHGCAPELTIEVGHPIERAIGIRRHRRGIVEEDEGRGRTPQRAMLEDVEPTGASDQRVLGVHELAQQEVVARRRHEEAQAAVQRHDEARRVGVEARQHRRLLAVVG